MAKKYEKPQSVLYKALVEKLKEQCANNPVNKNITIELTKEEIAAVMGEEELNNKLDTECSKLMYIRVEDEHMVATLCPSVSWNNKILSVEFSKYAIPYVIDEK